MCFVVVLASPTAQHQFHRHQHSQHRRRAMALPVETPSRIWRRIEEGEAQLDDMPSLPSLPGIDLSSMNDHDHDDTTNDPIVVPTRTSLSRSFSRTPQRAQQTTPLPGHRSLSRSAGHSVDIVDEAVDLSLSINSDFLRSDDEELQKSRDFSSSKPHASPRSFWRGDAAPVLENMRSSSASGSSKEPSFNVDDLKSVDKSLTRVSAFHTVKQWY